MIPAYLMLAAGVGLVMLEFMLGSFFVLFFGLGFLAVGVLGFFVDIAWEYQILLIAIVSLVLLFALRKPLKAKFNQHESEVKDDFLNESGEGEIREGMVYFKGTLWRYDGDLAEGSKVRVLGTKGNKVVLERD